MSSFSNLILKRQSVRKYQNMEVERETIQQIVAAVQMSPSACNSQPWKVVVVDEPELKNKVARATFNQLISFNKFTIEAPAIAVLVIEKAKLIAQIGGGIKNMEYPPIDIGIAAAHFCLQAAELGVGTCMIGWFDEQEIKQLLQIPEKRKIGMLITLGYPVDKYKQRRKIRKPLESILAFNAY